jgi:hypothetical protein
MTTRAIAEARRDLILRELLERAELREMCLRVLTERSGRQASGPPSALRLARDDESRIVR